MRPLTLLLVTALWLGGIAACGKPGPPPPDQAQFVDTRIFDDLLHDMFDYGHPAILVRFVGHDVTVNHMPERLDKWLYKISQQKGSKVAVLPDPNLPQSKGLPIGLALSLAIPTYNLVSTYLFYAPAGDYDATVYYAHPEGTLTRIIFTRRLEPAN